MLGSTKTETLCEDVERATCPLPCRCRQVLRVTKCGEGLEVLWQPRVHRGYQTSGESVVSGASAGGDRQRHQLEANAGLGVSAGNGGQLEECMGELHRLQLRRAVVPNRGLLSNGMTT